MPQSFLQPGDVPDEKSQGARDLSGAKLCPLKMQMLKSMPPTHNILDLGDRVIKGEIMLKRGVLIQ